MATTAKSAEKDVTLKPDEILRFGLSVDFTGEIVLRSSDWNDDDHWIVNDYAVCGSRKRAVEMIGDWIDEFGPVAIHIRMI